jgi:hypothetical protein
MITILITLWLYGYDITLDAKEIYNVKDVTECEDILPLIKMQYEAHTASCHEGDILNKGENI